MYHALFCVMPRLRCGFIPEMPVWLAARRNVAIAHFRSGISVLPITSPLLTERNLRLSRYWMGWGLRFSLRIVLRWAMPVIIGRPAHVLQPFRGRQFIRDLVLDPDEGETLAPVLSGNFLRPANFLIHLMETM